MSEGEMISPEKEESKATGGSPASRQGWSIDSVLKLIQVFAIVGAAVWGLHEYTSFRREHDQLLLEQSRFAVEQQGILKQQQALALDMAKVQLKSEKMRGELTQVELSSAKSPRLELTNSLDVFEIGRTTVGFGIYEALLEVNAKNISKEALEVTFEVIEYYVGTVSGLSTDTPSITPLNSPSTVFDSPKPGIIKWSRVGFSASALKTSTYADYKEVLSSAGIDPDKTAPDGRLTGLLRPGEITLFRHSYFVHAPTDAFVAFTVSLGINGGGEEGSIWRLENSQRLKAIHVK